MAVGNRRAKDLEDKALPNKWDLGDLTSVAALVDEDEVDDGSSGRILLSMRYRVQSGVYFISIFPWCDVGNDRLV